LHSQQVVCSALAAGLQSVGCASVVLPSREYALQQPLLGAPPDWVFLDSALAQDTELRAWLEKTGAQVRWYAGWSGAPIGCEANTVHGALTPARVRAVMATKALPNVPDAAQAPHTPRPTTTNRRARVLLVEDNAVNQLVASAMLKQLGYSVDIAGSGQECMRLLAMQSYAVVLMDCQMPGMDGFDTTRLIRALPQAHARGVAVIALTAGARQEDRQQCIDAGMDDFLSKPFRRAELEDMLKRWIRPEHETAQRTLLG
jgi:CheY-like chemotaxis protein